MNQIKTQIPLTSREAKARRWSKLSKLMVAVILLASVIIFITSGAFDWLLDTIAGKSNAAAPIALTEDAAAAVAENGLKTMFTVDYEAGYDAWVQSICAISTEKGCNATQDLFGSSMRANMENYKTDQVVSAVKAIKMVDERVTNDVRSQMWVVEITASGWEEEQTDLAVVELVEDNGAWKFEMLVPVPPEMITQMLTPTAVP